jgi:hypothetical protein
MEFSAEEIRKNAVSAMETCMAYCTAGDLNNAYRCRGEVGVWESMLSDLGIDLETENDHYAKMLEIWAEHQTADGNT